MHRNVAKLVKPPAVRREEARVLTIEEAERLLDVIRDDRLEAFWICALTLGLRRGELLGLRWDDIDFAGGLLAVRQTLQRADGSLRFVDPKTDRSRRVVPVPEPTLAALRRHRRAQAAEQLAAGKRWRNLGLVFPSTIGTPIEPGNLSTRWRATRKRAGLDWLRLHDLRLVPARLRRLTADRDEDARSQPDRADHEHVHARAPGHRTRGRRRGRQEAVRMTTTRMRAGLLARTGPSAVEGGCTPSFQEDRKPPLPLAGRLGLEPRNYGLKDRSRVVPSGSMQFRGCRRSTVNRPELQRELRLNLGFFVSGGWWSLGDSSSWHPACKDACRSCSTCEDAAHGTDRIPRDSPLFPLVSHPIGHATGTAA